MRRILEPRRVFEGTALHHDNTADTSHGADSAAAAPASSSSSPQPKVSLSHTSPDVALGNTFNETIAFQNTSSNATGYAPYVAVIVPQSNGNAATLNSLQYLGQSLSSQVTRTVSQTPDGLGVYNPYATDGNGNPVFVATPNASAQDLVVFGKLPLGSYAPNQPAAQVVANFTIDANTDIGANEVSLAAFGGFSLGADPQNNPSTDPAITGSIATDSVTTSLIDVSTVANPAYGASDYETATGPDFPVNYVTTITPGGAVGSTPVKNFVTTIKLPDTVQYSGGTITVNGESGSYTVTGGNAPGATITVTIPTLGAQTVIAIPTYIPQNDASGHPILGSQSMTDNQLAAPTVTYSADNWTNPAGRSNAVSGSADLTYARITAKPFAVQNAEQATRADGSVDTGVQPNDSITYTASVQVSDFNALSNLVLTETIDDGQSINPNTAPVFTWSAADGTQHSVNLGTIGNTKTDSVSGITVNTSGDNTLWSFSRDNANTGNTTATFNIGTAIQGLIASGILPAGTHGTLTFNTTALTAYTNPNNGQSSQPPVITEHDTLGASVTGTGDLRLADNTLVQQNDTDSGSSFLQVPVGQTAITIVAIERNNQWLTDNATLSAPLQPGDIVSYGVTYSLGSGDYNDLTLSSFLAPGVFSATDPLHNGSNNGFSSYSGSNTYPDAGTYTLQHAPSGVSIAQAPTTDSNANSLAFTLGQHGQPSAGQSVTIYFSVVSATTPMANGLSLSAFAQGALTNGTGSAIISQAYTNTTIAEPALTTTTGVVSVVNDSGTTKPITWTADPTGTYSKAGSTGSPFVNGASTTPGAADNNSVSSGIDGGDTVRIATTVQNTGAYGAYDVALAGILPPGITTSDIANFQVVRNDGTVLVAAGTQDAISNYFSASGLKITNSSSAVLAAGASANNASALTVIYDIKIPTTASVGTTFEEQGTILGFSNAINNVNFVSGSSQPNGASLTDDANATLTAPSLGLSVAASNNPGDDGSTSAPTIVIGETRPMTLTLAIPEGTISNGSQGVTITAALPSGMQAVDGTATLTLGNGVTINNQSFQMSANGSTLTFKLGDSVVNANQDAIGSATINFKATFPDSSNTAGSRARFAVNAQLNYTGAPAGSNTVTLQQIDPQLAPSLKSNVSGAFSSGQTITYTYTLTNNGGAIADDVQQILSLSNLTLVSGSATTNNGSNVAISLDTTNNRVLIGGTTSSGNTNTLAAGETVTFTFQATVNNNQAAGTTDSVQTASGSYNSMPTAVSSTGHVYGLAAQSSNNVQTYGTPQMWIVNDSQSGSSADQNVTTLNTSIGDIVRLRGAINLPRGSNNDVHLNITIPPGLLPAYQDGTLTMALISQSGSITSSTLDAQGNTTGLQLSQGSSATNPKTVDPSWTVPASAISFANGVLSIDLGTIANNDTANPNVLNQVVFEFNAIVANTQSNQQGRKLAETLTLASGSGGAQTATSNAVTQTITEPNVALSKTQTAVDPATGIVTYTVTASNTGNASAYNVVLADTPGSNTSYVSGSLTTQDQLFAGSGTNYTGGTFALLKAGQSSSFSYQVKITDPKAASPNTTASLTYQSQAGTQSLDGTTGGAINSATGPRDGSGGSGSLNDYDAGKQVGLSTLSGTLYSKLGNLGSTPSYDATTDTALSGITITATAGGISETTTTDSQGNFSFYGLPNGPVTITAPQSGGGNGLPAQETVVYITNGTAGPQASSVTPNASGQVLPGVQIIYRTPDTAPIIGGVDSSTVSTVSASGTALLLHGTSAATVADAQLDRLQSVHPATYSYGGTTLTVQRYNGQTAAPDATDVFGASGTLVFSGNNVLLGGSQIGTVTQQGGALSIVFANGTTAQTVAQTLSLLTFGTTRTTTDQTGISIGITLSDNNDTTNAAQGTGGNQISTPVFSIFNTVASTVSQATFAEPNNAPAQPAATRIGLPPIAGNTPIASVALQIATGDQPGEDVLAFTPNASTGNIQASFNAATGTLTLSSASNTATLAQWNAALSAISFYDTSDTPSTAQRLLTRSVTLGNGNVLTQSGAVALTVVANNDSPVLSSVNPSLSGVDENQSIATASPPAGAVGTLVNSLINTSTVTDPDANNVHDNSTPATPGMVITSADTTYGNWYYSTNNGQTWTEFAGNGLSPPSPTNALFLVSDAATRIAFAPTVQNYNGTVANALTYRAWDQFDPHANGTIGALPVGPLGSGTGAASSYSAATQSLAQTIIALNNAPIASGTTALPGITEDAASFASNTVAALYGGNFSDTADQQQNAANPTGSVANTLAGIAITSNPTPQSEGAWSYSTDGGQTWHAVPSDVSATNALILGSNARLSFLAAPNFNGAPLPLSAHLIDSSTQVAIAPNATGASLANTTNAITGVDISSNTGGESAISLATVDLKTTIAAINDAPHATGAATLPMESEDQGPNTAASSVFSLFNGNFNDAADQQQTASNPTGSTANTLAGIAIVGNTTPTSEGQWVYSSDGGKTWTPIGTVSETSALVLSQTVLVSFAPSANFNGTPQSLTVRLIDSSTTPVFGTTTGVQLAHSTMIQAGVDTTLDGGTTAISAQTVDLAASVTAVNDAPIASGSATLATSIQNLEPVSASVASLFGPHFDDSADAQASQINPTGSIANTLAGVAITGNTTPASEGAWQYSIDGGQTWTSIGTVSETAALVLSQNALLHFAPSLNFNGVPQPLTARLIDSSTTPVFGTTTGATIAQGAIAQNGVDASLNGGTTALSQASVTLETAVSAVHVAPVATGNAALPPGTEDIGPGANASVVSLFGPLFDGSANAQQTNTNQTGSIASNFAGIAITGNPTDATVGMWRYSTDNGQTWTNIGSVSNQNALILGKTALLDFVPATNFNGAPPALAVHVIDDSGAAVSSGLTGANVASATSAMIANIGNGGADTAVSSNTAALTTTVTAVNDAPVATGTATLPGSTEDQPPVAQSIATLFSSNFSDSADQQQGANNPTGSIANALAGVAITTNATPATEGAWQYSTDGGQTWTAVGTVSETSALVLSANTLLRFDAAPNFNGAPQPLTTRLIDSSTSPVFGTMTGAGIAQGGIAQNGVDVSINGGTSAVSASTVALATTVTAVNDAPIATGTATLPGIAQGGTPTGLTVASLFGGNYSDLTDQQQTTSNPTGSVAAPIGGVALVGNPTPLSEGAWVYSTDGGQHWIAVPTTIAPGQALVLPANTLIGFTPARDFNGAPLPLQARPISAGPGLISGNVTGANLTGVIAGVDLSVPDPTGAVALNTVPLSTTVTPAILRPEIVPGSPGSVSVPDNGASVANLLADAYTDQRRDQQSASNPTGTKAAPFGGIAISSNPAGANEGTWRYSLDGGQTWVAISTDLSPAHALVLPGNAVLAFSRSGNYTGPVELQAHLLRSGSVAAGSYADVGTGPYGQASASTITLSGMARAPVVSVGLPRLTGSTAQLGLSASAMIMPVVELWTHRTNTTDAIRQAPSSQNWLRGFDRDAVVLVQTKDTISVAGAFLSGRPGTPLTLTASMSDGTPLPDWITFDAISGTFIVIAPLDAPQSLNLRVQATDPEMRSAESMVRLVIGHDPMLQLLGSVPDLTKTSVPVAPASAPAHSRAFRNRIETIKAHGAQPIVSKTRR